MANKYKIIFLRPKEITRFRIQDGVFSDKTLPYIPADTIYSLYFSKLLEEDKDLQELNERLYKDNYEEDLEDIKEIFVKDIPKITSAYPYYVKDKKIYFYLPLIFVEVDDKKFRKKCREYTSFISVEYLNKLLENPEKTIKEIKELEKGEKKYKVWAPVKIELVTRNTINRISSTTKEEGSLFSEEYVFCYRKNDEEFGYYFLIEENEKTGEFLEKIREFFEIRGIGADKSVSNSVFELDDKEEIGNKLKIEDFEEKKGELFEVINKLKEEKNVIFHPLIINKNTKDRIEKVKLRFLVIDGYSMYPIASDGSKLKEKIEEPIVIKVRRRFQNKLSFRVFYGI